VGWLRTPEVEAAILPGLTHYTMIQHSGPGATVIFRSDEPASSGTEEVAMRRALTFVLPAESSP